MSVPLSDRVLLESRPERKTTPVGIATAAPHAAIMGGGRARKQPDYIRHYRNKLGAVLEAGDLILIEPFESFGYYIIREEDIPEVMPLKYYNISASFTDTLTAMPRTGSPPPKEVLIKALDVGRNQLGLWKIMCADPGFQMTIQQPAAASRFVDKAGARKLTWGNTTYHYMKGEYSMIPEVATFEDLTPLGAVATSTEINYDTHWVRIGSIGIQVSSRTSQTKCTE